MIQAPHHGSADELTLLLDGKLEPRLAKPIEAHLADCELCQKKLASLAGNQQWWESTEVALRSVTKQDQPRNQQAIVSDDLEPIDSSSWLHRISVDGHLGTFRLESTIGHGGTGVVALATDSLLNRRVAVKVLYPHLAANGAARQRFAREAQAAAAVVHPSVVPIHTVNAEHDPPYLVMTYVPGGSLQQRLDKHGALELVEVLRIGLQIAEGLSAAHAQGLVHRDVKPANILLEEGTDRVLLSDFGLARALDDATLTASGFVAGTPPYMSPEQARGDSVDCRSDLFSVGSLLFAMATGRPPFSGSSALMILQQVNDQPTPMLRTINERMPAWLERLIALCHAKNPSSRIASADQLADLLRGCLAHVQRPTVFPLPSELVSNTGPYAIWGGLVAVGIAIGFLTSWFVTPQPNRHDTPSQITADGPAPASGSQASKSVGPFDLTSEIENRDLGLGEFDCRLQQLESRLQLLKISFEEDWK